MAAYTSSLDQMGPTGSLNWQPTIPLGGPDFNTSAVLNGSVNTLNIRYAPTWMAKPFEPAMAASGLNFDAFQQHMPLFVGPEGAHADPGQLNLLFAGQAQILDDRLNALCAKDKSLHKMSVHDIYYSRKSETLHEKCDPTNDSMYYNDREWAQGLWTCPAQVVSKWKRQGVIRAIDRNNYHATLVTAGEGVMKNYWGSGDNVAEYSRVGFILKHVNQVMQYVAWSSQGTNDFPDPEEMMGEDAMGRTVRGEFEEMGTIYLRDPVLKSAQPEAMLSGQSVLEQTNAAAVAPLIKLKLSSRPNH